MFFKMFMLLFVVSACYGLEIQGRHLMFSNVLEKISVRFEVTNMTEYFYFTGPSCTVYLFKNLKTTRPGPVFQLNIVNDSNHDVYTAPLSDSLYFEGYPYAINGNLMKLKSKKGIVKCESLKTLTFFEKVSELLISEAVPSKVLFKKESSHLELLSLLVTIPLCIIIFYLKRTKETLV